MNRESAQFLNLPPEFCDPRQAGTIILPIPYGESSRGAGAAGGPRAIFKASQNLDPYDEVFKQEIHLDGVATLPFIDVSDEQALVMTKIKSEAARWIEQSRFLVTIGGGHSVTIGAFAGVRRTYSELSCVHIGAHADLRDEYNGNSLDDACVMTRIRERGAPVLLLGARSISAGEARRAGADGVDVVYMQDFHKGRINIERSLKSVGERVFLSIDVNGMDWSVIRAASRPEPGGFTWREMMDLLEVVFKDKDVVACAVTGLAPRPEDPNSSLAAARLVFKLIAMKQCIEHIQRIDGLVV